MFRYLASLFIVELQPTYTKSYFHPLAFLT
jgi:hypothetical protein